MREIRDGPKWAKWAKNKPLNQTLTGKKKKNKIKKIKMKTP